MRKVSREVQDGEEREVEVLNPSMYFAVEKAGLGSCGVNNIYLNGVRVAGMLADGETRYYHTDQVDSVKAVTDDAGMVQSRMEYLPFGETWFQEDGSTFEGYNLPKYNSQEMDRETGYYFYNARHYDPEIGRFVTADTIVPYQTSTQSWNRFSYCSNNPIIYKDPTGHAETTKEQARVGDVMLRREGGKEQAMADKAGVVTKAAAAVHNRIAGQTECKRGHSAIIREVFKYKDQVVGIAVVDVVGDKIVNRLITEIGSFQWDPKDKKMKFDKYENINQYDYFRVGTKEEGKML